LYGKVVHYDCSVSFKVKAIEIRAIVCT